MDIKRFDIVLKKVNALKQNIDLSGEEISRLEIELLKTYIKQLYESISEDAGELSDGNNEKTGTPEKEVPVSPKTPVSEVQPVPVPVPDQGVVEKPVASDVESKERSPEENRMDEALLAIFAPAPGSDLSDKLGSLPIKDLTKEFGINDRILTTNDLFGGSRELFNQTLQAVNGMDNFDQAREYLIRNIAEKYQWGSTENLKKAQRFVKLVKRRFGVK